jgi:hypothetical protein
VASLGATTLRRWVLRDGGPFGVVVPAPPSHIGGGLRFSGLDTCTRGLRGWSCGSDLFCCRRCVYSCGRVDVPIQPASAYSCAVTRVEVPIQPCEFIFFLSFLFVPMIPQDHSLAFFSAQSMKHTLSCAFRSKKIQVYVKLSKFSQKDILYSLRIEIFVVVDFFL